MSTTDATYRKEIVFDRETRDFAMYLDGELVGYARTYSEAETTLDELVFELLSAQSNTAPDVAPNDEERFWSKVEKTNDCWNWTSATNGRYGRFHFGSGCVYAHRFAYTLSYGSIPEDSIIRHKCDNPLCVNPSHLEIGTFADNTADMMERGRAAYVAHPCESNGRAKLTAEQVNEIRASYSGKYGEGAALARQYGVTKTTIRKILSGQSWRALEGFDSGATATATRRDGGSDVDECAAEVVGMLVEVAQTETAHTNAPDCCCDACMRASYAYLNTLPSLPVDVAALVIRGDDPTRVSAVLAHREEINFRQRCLLCGGDHTAEDCPRIHPIDATALLTEADAVIGRLYCPLCLGNHLLRDCPLKHGDHATEADVLLSQTASHPGPDCSCPDCTRAAERLIIDAFMTRLRFDAGVLCSFCGDDHADSACPQKRPLLAPRVCGNCGGQHSIQQCDEIRAALFAT